MDVDLPFSYAEVAAATSTAYADALGRSDMPVVGHWAEEAQASDAPKVLVIDDEVIVVNSVRRILTRKGYRVESAFTGRDALQRIQDGNYRLVLLDMRLPDWDGLLLLSRIKHTNPDLPVLVVTGYSSIETAVEAVQRGAADYMPKPFTPEELYQFTSRTLSRYSS
jgi:two-component system response regulator HydG